MILCTRIDENVRKLVGDEAHFPLNEVINPSLTFNLIGWEAHVSLNKVSHPQIKRVV